MKFNYKKVKTLLLEMEEILSSIIATRIKLVEEIEKRKIV